MNKLHELEVAADLYNAKILCITESHLNSNISDAEIRINNFGIFRSDRNTGKKIGGSCIYVHNTINAEMVETFTAPDSLAINISLKALSFKLACVYRSQNLTDIEQKNLVQEISSLKVNTTDIIKILGDFNLPDVNWDSMTVNCNINSCNLGPPLMSGADSTVSHSGARLPPSILCVQYSIGIV